jgi:hypothetical protein
MEFTNNTEIESKKEMDNEDFNLKDDLHNGQIYLIKNKINEKYYIGQAMCFTGSNNNRWGTNGRWKSHIREAIKSNQDHCILLNNAIRKYGQDNFEVSTLIKCNKDELDNYEVIFIKEYNSVKPNGYNLKFGGYSSKNNEDTILKMVEAHTGKEHSEETKNKISKTQIGNRRSSMKRKNEEDNTLPKYVCVVREDNILKGYKLRSFPIGVTEKKYLNDILFSIAKYKTKELALQACLLKLNELKEEYKYIEEELINKKEKDIELSIKEKKENSFKDKLPEFIYPIIEKNKISGYYVDNIINNKGKKYPKRIFNKNTNRWNLDKATKFVDMLKYINENKVDMKYFDISSIDINSIEKSFFGKYYLPKYFNVLRKKGELKGFTINGIPDKNYSDGKYRKDFQTINNKTMNDVYNEGIEFLIDLRSSLDIETYFDSD